MCANIYCSIINTLLQSFFGWLEHYEPLSTTFHHQGVQSLLASFIQRRLKFYIFLMHLIIFPFVFEPRLRKRGACAHEHSTNSVHIINTFKKQIEWRISLHPDYVPKRIPLSLFSSSMKIAMTRGAMQEHRFALAHTHTAIKTQNEHFR